VRFQFLTKIAQPDHFASSMKSRSRDPKPMPPSAHEIAEAMIDRWPTRATLAHDLQISYWTVASWIRRGYVPTEWWNPVLRSARRFGIHAATLKSLEALRDLRTAPYPTRIKARRATSQGAQISPHAQSRAV
jgi:hypothetical protein